MLGALKYENHFDQNEIKNYENHNNYKTVNQWNYSIKKIDPIHQLSYIDQLPLQRFYIILPKILHTITENKNEDIKLIVTQIDEIFKDLPNDYLYINNINLLKDLIKFISKVMNYNPKDTSINESCESLKKSIQLFNEISNNLFYSDSNIINLDTVKNIQWLVTIV